MPQAPSQMRPEEAVTPPSQPAGLDFQPTRGVQFAEQLAPPHYDAQPLQFNTGFQNKAVGIAAIGSEFLKGLASGRAQRFAQQEKQKYERFTMVHDYANRALSSGQLTQDQAKQISALLADITKDYFGQQLSEAGKEQAKDSHGSKVLGGVRSLLEGMTGGPLKGKKQDPEKLAQLMSLTTDALATGPGTIHQQQSAALQAFNDAASKLNPELNQTQAQRKLQGDPAWTNLVSILGTEQADKHMASAMKGFTEAPKAAALPTPGSDDFIKGVSLGLPGFPYIEGISPESARPKGTTLTPSPPVDQTVGQGAAPAQPQAATQTPPGDGTAAPALAAAPGLPAPEPYTTPLSTEQQTAYNQWRSTLPKDLQNTDDYDLQGAFAAGEKPDPKNQHMSDKHKKPNHMTFSEDSDYSGKNGVGVGGKWSTDVDGKDAFYASKENLKHHSAKELQDYFDQHEKGIKLILPVDTPDGPVTMDTIRKVAAAAPIQRVDSDTKTPTDVVQHGPKPEEGEQFAYTSQRPISDNDLTKLKAFKAIKDPVNGYVDNETAIVQYVEKNRFGIEPGYYNPDNKRKYAGRVTLSKETDELTHDIDAYVKGGMSRPDAIKKAAQEYTKRLEHKGEEHTAEITNTTAAVESAHPDWTEAQVKKEVGRLIGEKQRAEKAELDVKVQQARAKVKMAAEIEEAHKRIQSEKYVPGSGNSVANRHHNGGIDTAAWHFIYTGQVVFTGMQGEGKEDIDGNFRELIVARAYEILADWGLSGRNLEAIRASPKADTQAFGRVATQQAMVQSFGFFVDDQAKFTLELMKDVGKYHPEYRGDSPMVNALRQVWGSKFIGDERLASFVAQLKNTVSEYAKITAGATGAAGAPVQVLLDAKGDINPSLNDKTLIELLTKIIPRDLQYRMSGFDRERRLLSQQLNDALYYAGGRPVSAQAEGLSPAERDKLFPPSAATPSPPPAGATPAPPRAAAVGAGGGLTLPQSQIDAINNKYKAQQAGKK